MPKATIPSGLLSNIENCYLEIPDYGRIILNNLPDVSDSKSVVFNSEGIIGRSSPLHTYSYSDTRTISIQFHFVAMYREDFFYNLQDMRALQSCAYPREGKSPSPFRPPVICKLKIGNLLANQQDLCVVMQQYSVKWDTDIAWDEETLCPYKFDVDTTWMTVYTSADLPYASRIISSGR